MRNHKNRGNVNHEKHESNTENEKEEIINDKSVDHCVKRKYPLTHVFDFFRAFSCFSWLINVFLCVLFVCFVDAKRI